MNGEGFYYVRANCVDSEVESVSPLHLLDNKKNHQNSDPSYEIVCDEEVDDHVDSNAPVLNGIKSPATYLNNAGKLHLNLSSSKISLKSQSNRNKINKSIGLTIGATTTTTNDGRLESETTTKTKGAKVLKTTTPSTVVQQQQQRHRNATVINFKIAPLKAATENVDAGVDKDVDKAEEHPQDNVPEIVLTSYQHHHQSIAQPIERRQRPASSRASTAVTFRGNNQNNHIAATVITHKPPQRRPVAPPVEPPPPPPPAPLPPPMAFSSASEIVAPHLGTTTSTSTSDIYERQLRRDLDETSDEINSPPFSGNVIDNVATTITVANGGASGSSSGCGKDLPCPHFAFGGGGGGGSSTSPESLVDNILSAASSVSVRSSSESSLVRIPPPPTPPTPSPPPPPPASSSLVVMPPVRLSLSPSVSSMRVPPRRRLSVANGECSSGRGSGGGILGRSNSRYGLAGSSGMTRRPSTSELGHRRASTFVVSAADRQRSVRQSINHPAKSKINELKIPLSPIMNLPRPIRGRTTPLTTPISSKPTPTLPPPPVVLHMPTPTESNELQALVEVPIKEELSIPLRTRSPSPSCTNISIRTATSVNDITLYPAELKCPICMDVYVDPRTLHCLHTFCFQCLVEENFKADSGLTFCYDATSKGDSSMKSEYSSRSVSPEISRRSGSDSPGTSSRASSRRSSFNFLRKKSLERILLKPKNGKSSDGSPIQRRSNVRVLLCKICQYTTELPEGGLRQLPQNYLIVHKIEEFRLKVTDEIMQIWCSLCSEETNALYHCTACDLSLCMLCKEAHERQRSTANHKVKNIIELRRSRKSKDSDNSTTISEGRSKNIPKCSLHAGIEVRAFCGTCLQIACSDCLVLLHKGHRTEPICRAIKSYSKILADSVEQTRPLCLYADQSIQRLNEIAKDINNKCDDIEAQLEIFMQQYFEALEAHRKILNQQIRRVRETKMEMILEQQADMVRRSTESSEAVKFAQELGEFASDAELLSFVSVLLKRFEYCQRFRSPVDPKVSDIINFLPQTQAPSAKSQHGIPLYGIITLQVVDPTLCTLEWEGFSELRIHTNIEFTVHARDSHGMSLCHGGLRVHATVKYKDSNSKSLPVEVYDGRDGTYSVTFTPDSYGTLLLAVTINDRHIKDSPFSFVVRMVHPHSGTYHCCAFCSSKGHRLKMQCACSGRMPGTDGCGHGHTGHPGRRHWSCCGSVVQNSECKVTNKTLNS